MKPTENIERFIKNAKIKTDPAVNEAVLNNLLDELDKSEISAPADIGPGIWRIIMKTKITKFAVAAMIIVAALIGINHEDWQKMEFKLAYITQQFTDLVSIVTLLLISQQQIM